MEAAVQDARRLREIGSICHRERGLVRPGLAKGEPEQPEERIAGDDLALHAIGAVPYSLNDGSMSERFAAPAIGLGLRYRPMPDWAVRLEGYAAFAGRNHGTAIPVFLGAERWF